MIIGMDFGTTNSGMAVVDDRGAHDRGVDDPVVDILPIDPSAPNPRVARTALYITNEQAVTIGRAAIDLYFQHNLNRPVRMQRVWVGEIEVIADLVFYVTDVYAWADILSPGRLFLSIKTALRDVNYPGTVIGRTYYSLDSLIALYLTVTKARAEKLLGREIDQVVMGRPVHFAADEEGDRLAEARLLHAAFRAGYRTVYLQYEPVAAAWSYAQGLTRPENALIFDFGGGTLDITVMRLGEGRPRVLATGGIPVAGDVFDRKLVRAKLPRHFGEGSLYGPRHKALTVPQWIYDSFSDWQTIMELQSAENKPILREIAQTAQRRSQIEALIALAGSNYGLKMFDIVEEAKRALSDKRGAAITLDGPGFEVHEFVTRGEFEGIIRGETRAIEHHLLETVSRSGLRPDQIDSVIRTGGSALIPVFHEMLGRHFGEAKVRSIDTFSSVTAGLGIIGRHLERGEVDLPAHTPADFADLPETTGGRLNIPPANLELLQRRIILEEQGSKDPAEQGNGLVLLGRPGTGARVGVDLRVCLPGDAHPEDVTFIAALRLPADDQLLLITSRYRFLLTTARQLADLRGAGLGIGDVHRFADRETVATLVNWTAAREMERLLLVTSTGYARAYPLDALRAAIESPAPLTFDNPPPGVPVAAQGIDRSMDIVIVTEAGRAVRWSSANIPLAGVQALNPGRDAAFDRVTTALAAVPEGDIALILADGFARRLRVDWVAAAPRANAKGKALVARKSSVVGLALAGPLTLITDRRTLAADAGTLPLEDSTKAFRLVAMEEGESVTAVASDR